ncbi:MAG: MlaD family protein [Rhodospirillales bacterium]
MTEARGTFLRVGLLILGGAGILIGLLWFLGGTQIRNGTVYESYFGESVQGLEIGVAVRYRGVAVGRVTDIGLVTAEYGAGDTAKIDQTTYRLVFVRYLVDPKRAGRLPDTTTAVKLGLRSRLASAGLTGITYIELDFQDPGKNPAATVPWTPMGEYIPSVPTTLSRVEDATKMLIEKLNQIDIVRFADNATHLLENTDRLVASVEEQLRAANLPALTASMRQSADSLRRLAENPDIGRILAGSAAATEKLTQTIAQIPPLIASVQTVAKRADSGMADTQQALVPLLRDLTAATANLRDITASLRRDPAQILTGAPPPRQTGNGR